MSLHALLKQQFQQCRQPDGHLDLRRLLETISDCYARWENAGDHASSQLQIVLDHVKDAILTVDADGRIHTLNTVGERVFGFAEEEARGCRLDLLIPSLARRGSPTEALDELAESIDDTQFDLTPREIQGRNRDGTKFDAEVGVTRVRLGQRDMYVVCLRDTSDRKRAESALRDSEARYRTLVENAPEAIVVLDIDSGRFVECNENAVRFFRMRREELLESGPERISPPTQADGTPSFGIARGHLDRALAGETPSFEWLHCDATGQVIPCEVRLVRLPASDRRLVRGSITDITERKRAEFLAAGERRVFERITVNTDLEATLAAIVETAEGVTPDAICTVSLLDGESGRLRLTIGSCLPAELRVVLDSVESGPRNGSCAAAIFLQRQVIVAEIARDAFWEHVRAPALAAGLRAAWSTPIRSSDGRVVGTVALYFHQPRSPLRRDFELMGRLATLAALAIERKRAEDALRASEARYRGLFENVVEGVYRRNVAGRLESVNPALVRILGFESAEALMELPNTHELYVDQSDRERILAVLARHGEVLGAEFQLRRRDGSVITVIENARLLRDGSGEVIGTEGTLVDITVRKRAETQLFEEKEKAQVTLQAIGDAVIAADAQGRIEYLNPVAEDLTGWRLAEVLGRPIGEVLALVGEGSRQPVENPVLRCLRGESGVELSESSILIARDGQEIGIQESASPIRDRSGRLIGAVMVFHDVSQERRLQRALAHQASHDALTGLINRREFEIRLGDALRAARQDPTVGHVLVYLDLDQFKVVNDTCGHPAGDRLLKQITGVLQTRIRAADTLARLGGDEFGILLADCTLETAQRIAETLRQAIRDFRFIWHDRVMHIGVSIGLAEINASSENLADMLSAADVACYSAKDSGRNRVQTYRQGRAPERHREMHWVARITRACEEDGLVLLAQPIVPIRAGVDRQRHFELLLRMRDEDGSLIQPAEFMPAAERFNLMPTVDRWVLRQACRLLAHRRSDEQRPPFVLGVNVSASTLNDEQFLDFAIAEVEAAALSPAALCFELTEASAMSNLANATHFTRELRARGCRFALDDFGNGLSSFTFLKSLPVDYLKLDGHFMHNVAPDPVDEGMVEAMVRIGASMGIRTIAERVDSAGVLARLADLGVDYAQGHYIAQPSPVEVLADLTRAPQASSDDESRRSA
jgi:diguanylate cyclase (GGDEF)-like protein/PAS domain S-box-containing protein